MEANALRAEGATVIFIAIDNRLAGLLAIADPIKTTAAAAIKVLQQQGIHIVMLTGDNRRTAEAVAAKLAITEVKSEILPEDKGKIVRKLREAGRIVAMASDGINNEPHWLRPM